MSKRMFNLLLAVLMVVAVVFGPMANTVSAADEDANKWTLVEFTWEQLQYNKSIAEEKAYALVGSGKGDDVFTEFAPDEVFYSKRFEAVLQELKAQANAEKQTAGISLVQIKGEPAAFTFKTGSENEATFTKIAFNGQEVAKVEGDSAFIIASWSLDNYKAEPAADDATLYLYHEDGCMNGEGVKRELCNGCGLVTVHEMLSFCGHSSCVEAKHEPAMCGEEGHKACYDRHGYARCGLKGHHVCTGVHDNAACQVKNHYVCDGKKHTACPGCGKLQCAKDFKASEHKLAPCGGVYICSTGYKEADHKMMDCGHYTCASGDHTKDDCGHYKCIKGYKAEEHDIAACGSYACKHAGPHKLGACGAHYTCVKSGSHEIAACGSYACMHTGPHTVAACGHFACAAGKHTLCSCGGFACSGDHTGHTS